MTARRVLRRLPALVILIAACGTASTTIIDARQLPPLLETARVTVPAVIVFEVNDIGATSDAITGVTVISFDQTSLTPGRALRLSAKADGDLTRADGGPVPVATITWRTSAVSNGAGVNGTLSKTAFTEVYQSNILVTSGSVTVTWSVALSGTPMRAGPHQLSLRWRVDSVVP
ncbi:hypothetical protein BH18ACI5_BH18ACI5_29880 [soil metagenome]